METLISTGLLGLVLLGSYALIVFALRWNSKMSDAVNTYQQALKASSRISYDLGTGSQDSFIYDLDGFAFASARPPAGRYQLDSSGNLLWHRYIVYYTESGVLYRHEIPIDPPTASLGPTPDLATLKGRLTGPGAVMAENFSGLEVEPGSGAAIRFKVQGEQKETNSISLESRMTFRQ